MWKPQNGARALLRDQRGLTTVEYTILLTLIVVLCVGAWQTLGTKVKSYLDKANDEITNQLG